MTEEEKDLLIDEVIETINSRLRGKCGISISGKRDYTDEYGTRFVVDVYKYIPNKQWPERRRIMAYMSPSLIRNTIEKDIAVNLISSQILTKIRKEYNDSKLED